MAVNEDGRWRGMLAVEPCDDDDQGPGLEQPSLHFYHDLE
jgi:hypothetical protein